MKYLSRMIAWKYLTHSAYESTISTMVTISFAGIFIGSFALALVTAIMHGFDIETRKKIQGIHAQATLRAYGESLNIDALIPVLKKEFPEILAYAPSSETHGLLQENSDDPQTPTVVMIKAIDPKHEPTVTTLEQKINTPFGGSFMLLESSEHNTVIIGHSMAQERNIKIGDTIHLFHAKDTQPKNRKITFNTHETIVKGFIKTGIDEFDRGIVLCSFDLFNTLFPDIGIQELQVTFTPSTNVPSALENLKKRLALEIYSWEDLYPALVSALKLEKYVSFFVLALITLVASMNIIALLFMKIIQKRGDIAILKAMGATDSCITHIFLLLGIGISSVASIAGICCATLTSIFLEHYPFITLPDVYYVSHLPAHMAWYIPIGVFAIVLFMSFIATWIPARRTRYISVSQTLRFEG